MSSIARNPTGKGLVPNVKGQPRRGGIEKGQEQTATRVMREMKEAFAEAFEALGGVPELVAWAKKTNKNKTEFYKMCTKLIPLKLVGSGPNGEDAPLEIPIVFVGGQLQLAPSPGQVFDMTPLKLPHLNGSSYVNGNGAAPDAAGGSKPTG